MSVYEIQSDINSLNSQIRGLGNSRTNYQNMNNQINQAITELSTAYNYIVNARKRLSENYSSEAANKKVEELRGVADDINALISKLRDQILAESNRKITSIGNQIQGKQNEVLRKNIELQEERNKN